MKIIVGLGNPGEKYAKTRHNIGFMILDRLSERLGIAFKTETKFLADIAKTTVSGETIYLIKPLTYMNLSGDSIMKFLSYYQANTEDILVIVDDIHLPFGKMRLRELGGHGGHNGIRDIILKTKSEQFKRIRIGVGLDDNMPLDHFVLSSFSKKEFELLEDTIEKAMQAVLSFINNTPYKDIMTRFNTQT